MFKHGNEFHDDERRALMLEIVQFDLRDGTQDRFTEAWQSLVGTAAAHPEIQSLNLGREARDSTRFAMLVEWRDLAAHEAFRATDTYAAFRAAITPLLAKPPVGGDYQKLTD